MHVGGKAFFIFLFFILPYSFLCALLRAFKGGFLIIDHWKGGVILMVVIILIEELRETKRKNKAGENLDQLLGMPPLNTCGKVFFTSKSKLNINMLQLGKTTNLLIII